MATTSRYDQLRDELRATPRHWLVTGVAVTGLDNFATGKKANLDEVQAAVGPERFGRFRFVEGSVASREDCAEATRGVEIVLHQAALGSVPRSIEEPLGR